MTSAERSLPLAKAQAGTAGIFVERRSKIWSRGADGGDQTKEDSGENRNAQRKQQDADIERDGRTIFSDARNIAGVDAEQQSERRRTRE